MKERLINSIAFALKLRTMKSCLLGAPGCGKDRAKVVEMVEKMLSVEPTIEPQSNLWWRDAKTELPPKYHTECPRGNNPTFSKVSDTVWLYYEDGNQTEGTLEGNLWFDDLGRCVSENPAGHRVSHWMPLPKPPKEISEDGT